MWNEKAVKPFLVIYVCCLFLATFFIIPTITSFYYYAWGKHLAWSYFDGPPMIAYLFHVSHAIFGNTFFSINIIGFVCFIAGAFYIYKTGCLLGDKRTGLISALIWAVLPTTTESVFVRVLYDAPLNLFTILTVYYFSRYSLQQRVSDLYLSAFFIGAMILSKYTAAVSILSILLYVIFSKQRRLFKNPHFYLANGLILLMASPVLYWNIAHHWISISYLLNFHSQTQGHTIIVHCLQELLLAFAMNYSIFLVLAVLGWLKYRKTSTSANNSVLEFLYVLLFIGCGFWFLVTLLGGEARVIYLAPLGINIALVVGYTLTQYHYEHWFKIAYPVFLLISIGMILANSWPLGTYLKKNNAYTVIKNTLVYPGVIKETQPLVTGYYTNAAALSFFKPEQSVYAIPCGDINQYQYWNAAFLDDLAQGKVKKITYVDFRDTKHCPEQFFSHCEPVVTLSQSKVIPIIHKSTKPVSFYVYECSGTRISA